MKDHAPLEPLVVDADEAARLCGVGRTNWYALKSSGRLPEPIRLGRRTLWRVDELRRWVSVWLSAAPSLAADRSAIEGVKSFELFADGLMQIWHPKFTKAGVQQMTKKLYARFYDHQGVRRTLPLFDDQKSSDEAGRAIERLVNYRASGTDLPIELHRFVLNTLPSIRTKLAEWGIIDAARFASVKSLDEYLGEWKQSLISIRRGKDYVETKVARVRRLFEACKFRMLNDISSTAVVNMLAKWRDDPDEK